jgi:hypothetical protein
MTDPSPFYRYRPTAVTVIAILNFIIGGLTIVGLVCSGMLLLFAASVLKSVPPPPGGGPNPMTEMTDLFQSIPGYIPYMIVSAILGVIMAVVLIVAGVGLLKMRLWARRACVVYSVYSILGAIGGFIYTTTVVNPAMERWQANLMARSGLRGPPPSSAGGDVSAVIGSVVGMAYGITLLVVLFLPHVSAAFAGKALPETGYFLPEQEEREQPRDQSVGREGGDSFRPPDGRRW